MAEAFVLVNCLTPEPSIDMKELVIKLKVKISLFRCCPCLVVAASHIDSAYFIVYKP
ncbi:hypothetical protein ES703_77345 [subsurface metagenome]